MINLDFGKCDEVQGERYCMNLYMFAESIEARRILEIGAGWGFSSAAFAKSMANREGSELTSVDPVLSRMREDNAKSVVDSRVLWNRIDGTSGSFTPSTKFDIVYIDGDPLNAVDDIIKFMEFVRPGGYLIVDGYGGQCGPTSAVESYPNGTFIILPYSFTYGHAIHQVEDVERLSDSRTIITCDNCDDLKDFSCSWVDSHEIINKHILGSGHSITSMTRQPSKILKERWKTIAS